MQLGSWCTMSGSWSAEALGRAGFSWVVIDLQHGVGEDLLAVLQAVELGGATPYVRVGWNEPQAIMRALDHGAAGVIVPMVDDADGAARAARACRYPPDGNRSYGPIRRRDPDTVRCLPMIETAAGLGAVEHIAAVSGVGGLFVGPLDLGLDLGLGVDPTTQHPDVLAAIDRCVAAAHAHGGVVGTTAVDAEHAHDLARRGVDMVTIGSDRGFVAAGAAAAVQAFGQR